MSVAKLELDRLEDQEFVSEQLAWLKKEQEEFFETFYLWAPGVASGIVPEEEREKYSELQSQYNRVHDRLEKMHELIQSPALNAGKFFLDFSVAAAELTVFADNLIDADRVPKNGTRGDILLDCARKRNLEFITEVCKRQQAIQRHFVLL